MKRLSLFSVLSLLVTLGCDDSQSPLGGPVESSVDPTSQPSAVDPGSPAEGEEPAPQAPTQPRVETPSVVERAPELASHGELGSAIPVDIAAGDDTEHFVRSRRRMNLEQLQAQIAHATGGRQWIEDNKNQFEELAATLGRPDYVSTLFEDLSAGPVFQKFLGDAARAICSQMAEEEPDAAAEDRVLMAQVDPTDTYETNPDGVDANLVQLMLRFHGLSVGPDAPVLSKYRWLFQSVTHTTGASAQGWRLVCVALMSHPRFYSY